MLLYIEVQHGLKRSNHLPGNLTPMITAVEDEERRQNETIKQRNNDKLVTRLQLNSFKKKGICENCVLESWHTSRFVRSFVTCLEASAFSNSNEFRGENALKDRMMTHGRNRTALETCEMWTLSVSDFSA